MTLNKIKEELLQFMTAHKIERGLLPVVIVTLSVNELAKQVIDSVAIPLLTSFTIHFASLMSALVHFILILAFAYALWKFIPSKQS